MLIKTSDAAYLGIDHVLRTGVDPLLTVVTPDISVETDADIYYLMRAAHNLLYVEANALVIDTVTLDYASYFQVIFVEVGVLAAICVVSIALRTRRYYQENPKRKKIEASDDKE